MTIEYTRIYEEIAAAFRFERNGRLAHKHAGVKAPSPQVHPGSDVWRAWATNSAWPIIYRWHYLRQMRIQPAVQGFRQLSEMEDPVFAGYLSAANRSAGFTEDGWTIVGRTGGEYLCDREGIRLRVNTSSLETGDQQPELGEEVSVRFPAERRYALANYYCTGGGRAKETDFRVYFHVKPECAAWLVETLTEELARVNASYFFKILNHPGSFTRPDAAVLYMNESELDHGRAVTKTIACRGAQAFRTQVPAFTRRLYPGVAVADEPPDLDGHRPSFGEHRSRIIALGLTRAAAESRSHVEDIVTMMQNELRHEGIDPKRPFSSGERSAAAQF
jgi:hypothetical protein